MIIRELTIRRFKQFDDVRFAFSGNVVLAGQNNAGKTTVLQALSAWSLALTQWQTLHDLKRHNGGYSRKPLTRQAFNSVPLRSFDLLWRDRQNTGPIEIGVGLADGRRITMEINADSSEQVYVRPTKDTLRVALEQPSPTMVYVSSVDGLDIEEGAINNPELIQSLLARQHPGSILRNLLLDVSRTNGWDDLCQSVKRLFGFELLVPGTPGGFIVCEYRCHGSDLTLDIMGAGSGFHQVLLLLACLYTRPGAVLLIDEPDAHLHVFLQDTIFSEIRKVAAKSGAQVILATHSEVIFRSVPPQNLTVMMGTPRVLSTVAERDKLASAMQVLEQVDVVNALEAPGVLYFEGYTDLNLLRTWATILGHGTTDYLNRQPFWKPQVWEARDGAPGIKAQTHFDALKLVREDITGVWLVDSDGKTRGIQPSPEPRTGVLNRIAWTRYETESYLVHPHSLARFVSRMVGSQQDERVREFFVTQFGRELTDRFYDAPLAPAPVVENYLRNQKARTEILGALFAFVGIHGFEYTDFDQIAEVMTADEIDPEVVEKLDFIQRAFNI